MNFPAKRRATWARKEGDETRDKIYNFYAAFWIKHHYGPSIEEIVEGTSISSKSVVHYHIHRMLDKGRLEGDAHVARSIHPAGMEIKMP